MRTIHISAVIAAMLLVGCSSTSPSAVEVADDVSVSRKNTGTEAIQGIVRYNKTWGRFKGGGIEEPGISQSGAHGQDGSGTVTVWCFPDASWCYRIDNLGGWVDVREGITVGTHNEFQIEQEASGS